MRYAARERAVGSRGRRFTVRVTGARFNRARVTGARVTRAGATRARVEHAFAADVRAANRVGTRARFATARAAIPGVPDVRA